MSVDEGETQPMIVSDSDDDTVVANNEVTAQLRYVVKDTDQSEQWTILAHHETKCSLARALPKRTDDLLPLFAG